MADLVGPGLCHCLAVRKASRQLTRLYDAHLAPAGLTLSQYAVLAVLRASAGSTMAGLAQRLGMDRTTAVRALRPLADAGLVDARHEGRSRALHLTEAGCRKLDQGAPLWAAAQQAFEAGYGAARAAHLRAELAGLRLP